MLIEILTQRCNSQRLMIAEAYRDMYGRVGSNTLYFHYFLLSCLLCSCQPFSQVTHWNHKPVKTAGWNNRLAHNFAYWLLIPLKVSCCHFYSSHTHCLPHSYKRTGKVPSSTVHSSLFTNLKFLNRLVSSFMWGF